MPRQRRWSSKRSPRAATMRRRWYASTWLGPCRVMDADAVAARLPAIPRGVWVLGFVSLLMDVSSEMIHALLPLYLTVALGASALMVGVIEGLAEATALVVRVFSGTLSDRWGKRQPLAAFG